MTTKRLLVLLGTGSAVQPSTVALDDAFDEKRFRAATAVHDVDIHVASVAPDRARRLAERWIATERLSLGEYVTLHGALDDAFAKGYAQVVVVGDHVPSINTHDIEAAFAWLTRNDASVVIGPTRDGEVCLLGAWARAGIGRDSAILSARSLREQLTSRGLEVHSLAATTRIRNRADLLSYGQMLRGSVNPYDRELYRLIDETSSPVSADAWMLPVATARRSRFTSPTA